MDREEQQYKDEQEKRTDIDQTDHALLVEMIARLERERDAAPPHTRRAWRSELAVLQDSLYELRHGHRTELGNLSDRTPMWFESKLHAAHRALNTRAEDGGDYQHRSPYSRADLAMRSDGELPDLARRGEALVRLFRAADEGRPDSKALAHQAHAELTAYVRGESLWREREID